MSVATEISRIQSAKADIKSAIEAKGVTVPSSAKIDTYDDYVSQISSGGDTSTIKGLIDRTIVDITVPSDCTRIGNNAFSNCRNLSSITINNTVTEIQTSAFANSGAYSVGLDVSSIDLSNVEPNTTFLNVFSGAYIRGTITIPNSVLSGSSSGTSSTCYGLFYNASCIGSQTLNIKIYANNRIIPRNICFFNNGTTLNTGNIYITVYGVPTFLSRQSFRLISGTGIGTQSVTFADCTTPPNAESYATASSSPFYGFTGTVYVPSAGLSAWKAKYTGIADKIQAIPT